VGAFVGALVGERVVALVGDALKSGTGPDEHEK